MLKDKLQVINFLLVPFFWLAITFSLSSWPLYLVVLIFAWLNLLLLSPSIKYRQLFYFSLGLAPALLAMFVSSYLFASPISATLDQDLISFGLKLTPQLLQSLTLSLRLYSLAMLSFAFVSQMPHEKLISTLLQWRILPVKIGFALFAVFNAFKYLSQEFERIWLAYQMRYQRYLLSPKILLPLLVAAARYSHNLSISMYVRGLNQHRSYYHQAARLSRYDCLLWLLNISLALALYLIKLIINFCGK